MFLALGFALAVQAAHPTPSVELRWPPVGCPSRAQVDQWLMTAGIDTAPAGSRGTLIQAEGTLAPDGWKLALSSARQSVTRRVPAEGACDEQAALIAAIIERFARPILSKPTEPSSSAPRPRALPPARPVVASSPALPTDPPADVAPPANPRPAEAPVAIELPREEQAGSPAQPLLYEWSAGGTLAVSLSGALQPGLEVELARRFEDGWRGAIGLGWLIAQRATASNATLEVNQLRLQGSVGWRRWDAPVRVDAQGLLRGAWARSLGVEGAGEVLRFSLGLGLGVTFFGSLGAFRLEVTPRLTAFPQTQAFEVEGGPRVTLAPFEAALRLGVSHSIF